MKSKDKSITNLTNKNWSQKKHFKAYKLTKNILMNNFWNKNKNQKAIFKIKNH
jgi:hypothetical protein